MVFTSQAQIPLPNYDRATGTLNYFGGMFQSGGQCRQSGGCESINWGLLSVIIFSIAVGAMIGMMYQAYVDEITLKEVVGEVMDTCGTVIGKLYDACDSSITSLKAKCTGNLVPVQAKSPEKFAQEKPSFVLYTWTKCGACKRFTDTGVWNDLQKNEMLVARYNFIHYESETPETHPVMLQENIHSFPTMQIENGSSRTKFAGPRTVQSITDFLKNNQ